jgi:hypothetical protein
MSYSKFSSLAGLSLLLALVACDGQQYVSPDTVGLLIRNDDTQIDRVNRCNYVPVLLGSEVKSRYAVEGDAKATITITRDDIVVTFEGFADDPPPFEAKAKEFSTTGSSDTAPTPPSGYSVTLSSGCTPED